jgi:hypothetical protein
VSRKWWKGEKGAFFRLKAGQRESAERFWTMEKIKDIRADLAASADLSDYDAVDVLWVALTKLANLNAGRNEHSRMVKLVSEMPIEMIRQIMDDSAVDVLLDLDPPLESVLADPHERLDAERTAQELARVRARRRSEPREGCVMLGEVLKRVRNRRAHGFKSRCGPRDSEILGASRRLLWIMCRGALEGVMRDAKGQIGDLFDPDLSRGEGGV